MVGGYNTEYGGGRFAAYFAAEYANVVVVSGLVTTLFFGGWLGPWLPPFLWFTIKVFVLILFFILLRAAIPRPRYDQLMNFTWKTLLPIALVYMVLTTLLTVFLK